MPLMGSLYIGQSGLQTSQNALNTTAHNMSNLDTTGYTRQQVSQGDKQYNTIKYSVSAVSNQQIGLGVTYSKVRQVRDVFLDQTYRRESGRSAFYTTSYEAMSEVENILGEMYGATFDDAMGNFKEAIDELAKTPTDSVVQGLVVQRAATFLQSAQAVYQGLCNYQDNLNLQIKTNVEKINEYGRKIYELNQQIVKIEAAGVENANDLRDARNQLLDELGAMARISYKEDTYGNVTVRIEDHDFIAKDFVYEIGLQEDDATGFYTPFWLVDASFTVDENGEKHYDIEGAEVFELERTISSGLNTDVGGIKAMLLARGDKRANYSDLENEAVYNKEISQSIIMNIQAEFDQLIHSMVTTINEILADAADTSTGYLCEEVMVKGVKTYQPIQLFQKKVTEGYEYGSYVDENGVNQMGWIYSEEDAGRTETLYTTSNLIVNPALLQEPTKLSFRRMDKKDDYETAAALAESFQLEELTLNPNVTMRSSFTDYYSDLVSQIANSGSVYKSFALSQADTVEATCAAREQIVGVSSDEEMTNMVKFQNAYNASSRYINVISEMLEHIINTLAT